MQILASSQVWKIEKECIANKNNGRGCEAVLEVEAVDIYLSYQHVSGKDKNNYLYTFRCPCCNKETIIPESEIPLSVRRAILGIEQANGAKLKYLRKLGYR